MKQMLSCLLLLLLPFVSADASALKAMASADVAWVYIAKGGEDKAVESFVMLALDGISISDARQQKAAICSILPPAGQQRCDSIRQQRNTWILALPLALLLALAVFAGFILVKKKNRLLTEAEERVAQTLRQLDEVNRQLVEANNIKTEYVGLSFCATAEAIARMEKLYKGIERQLKTKQYDKIKESVNAKHLETERMNMYSAFDASFLGLYPDFVEKYNALFAPGDRRYPEKERTLTSEMRIFALIRLGITDSERIAKCLDYSIHTVNTYKTRIKNRSIVDNDKFEACILQI